MAVYKRWRMYDANGSYTFPRNPSGMTSPFGERNIHTKTSSAVDGQVLLFEGAKQAPEWTFTGRTLEADHYEALRAWVYDRLGRRVVIVDHFGRNLVVVLKKFDPIPKRAVGKYWSHEYTVTAIVISISAPTVAEVPA